MQNNSGSSCLSVGIRDSIEVYGVLWSLVHQGINSGLWCLVVSGTSESGTQYRLMVSCGLWHIRESIAAYGVLWSLAHQNQGLNIGLWCLVVSGTSGNQ